MQNMETMVQVARGMRNGGLATSAGLLLTIKSWTESTESLMSSKELKAKMQAATSDAAPSMVPDFNAPPPYKEKEAPPDIKDVIPVSADRLKILKLIREYAELNETKREVEAQLKPLSNRIKSLMGAYHVGSMVCDDRTISYYAVPRSKLNKEMLLGAGVSPEIIQRCTQTSVSYTLRVSRPGEEDKDGNGKED
jgi:hypothetical protein